MLSDRQKRAQLWRRDKVRQFYSRGYNVTDISKELSIPDSTISKDIKYLHQRASKNIDSYMDDVTMQTQKVITQFEDLVKIAWKDVDNSKNDNSKDKYNAINVIKECNIAILEIMAGAIDINKLNKLSLTLSKEQSSRTTSAKQDKDDTSTQPENNTKNHEV